MSTVPPPPPSTHSVNLWVARPATQRRSTIFFRGILAIPLFFLEQVWNSVMQVVAVIQWFLIAFTGKRNADLRKLQLQYLTFATRTYTYAGLLYDSYPPFGENSPSPVQLSINDPGSPPRAAAIFRVILAIPAMIISSVILTIGILATGITWIIALVVGSVPAGLHDFLVRVHRYAVRFVAYLTLVVDDYPKWN